MRHRRYEASVSLRCYHYRELPVDNLFIFTDWLQRHVRVVADLFDARSSIQNVNPRMVSSGQANFDRSLIEGMGAVRIGTMIASCMRKRSELKRLARLRHRRVLADQVIWFEYKKRPVRAFFVNGSLGREAAIYRRCSADNEASTRAAKPKDCRS